MFFHFVTLGNELRSSFCRVLASDLAKTANQSVTIRCPQSQATSAAYRICRRYLLRATDRPRYDCSDGCAVRHVFWGPCDYDDLDEKFWHF